MKAYLAVTASLFALLVIMHVWRLFLEPYLLREPFFLLTTVISIGAAAWGFSLLRGLRATPR